MAKAKVPDWVWFAAGLSGLALLAGAVASAPKAPVFQCHRCGHSPIQHGTPRCQKCGQIFVWDEPRG